MEGKNWKELKVMFQREKMLVVSNFVILTVTFLILGLFLSTAVGFQTALRSLEEQAQITIFFKDDFTENRILELKKQYEADPRILQVDYVSKDQAYQIFTEMNKDAPILLEAISANILPASLEIKTEKLEDLSTLASEFEKTDGVEEVKFFEDVIGRFRYWTKVIYVAGLVLVSVFLAVSLSIIITTLRMAIHSKGEEIEIMKLVGASDSYIRRPLIFQGVFFGVFSALFSSILLIAMFILFQYFSLFGFGKGLSYQLAVLPGVKVAPWIFVLALVGILLSVGALVSFLGSWTAVKKYLKY